MADPGHLIQNMKGTGIDIIEIERIREAVDRYGENFLQRVFTPHEINYCRRRKKLGYPELSVRFAAKEAYSKAIGLGISGLGRGNKGINWKDVEVVNNSYGKPSLSVKGTVAENVQVSLSHSRDYAIASVYVE
jgi:holo-[acyl-carrier protein] synthase